MYVYNCVYVYMYIVLNKHLYIVSKSHKYTVLSRVNAPISKQHVLCFSLRQKIYKCTHAHLYKMMTSQTPPDSAPAAVSHPSTCKLPLPLPPKFAFLWKSTVHVMDRKMRLSTAHVYLFNHFFYFF